MDLIDRRQAVKIIDEIDTFCGGWRDYAIERIMDLPSAEKRGKWYDLSFTAFDGCTVWHRACSVCGCIRDDDNHDKDANYCPYCGAKMESEE